MMFYIKYNSDPVDYRPPRDMLPQIKKARKRGVSYLNRTSLKKITHGIRKCILADCLRFNVNYGKFLYQNFISKDHLLFLRDHDPKFACKDHKNKPWLCDSSNSQQILGAIYNELRTIRDSKNHNIWKEKPYTSYVTVDNPPAPTETKVFKSTSRASLNEDPSIHAIPFCQNVRKKLGNLWTPYDNHFYTFRGIYKGVVMSPDTTKSRQAVLLQDIFHDGDEMTNHCWIFNNIDIYRLSHSGLAVGQHFIFDARVHMYVKHTPNDPCCDFGLDHVTHIRLNTKQDDSLEDLSKSSLLKLTNQLFDKTQLIYLLKSKRDNNSRSLSVLSGKLSVYEHKVHVLKSQYDEIHNENDNVKRTLNLIRSHESDSKLHDHPQKASYIADHNHHKKHINVSSFKLVGSLNLLKAITALWHHHKLYSVVSKYHINPSRILGRSRKLVVFLKNTKSDIKNVRNYISNFNLNDVIKLASKYQMSALNALHMYYHKKRAKSHVTIHKLETENDLSSGSLLMLRKSRFARLLYNKCYRHK